MDDPYNKRIWIYLILMAIVFLVMCFVIGYVIGFLSIKQNPTEISFVYIQGNSVKAPRIPYIPKFQVLGTVVNETLYKIIKCESGFDPNAKNPNSSAKGLGQIINSTLELCEKGLDRELDAYNPKDNLDCCEYLYQLNGTKDWKSSEECWQ